jgi:DUF1365 family protein
MSKANNTREARVKRIEITNLVKQWYELFVRKDRIICLLEARKLAIRYGELEFFYTYCSDKQINVTSILRIYKLNDFLGDGAEEEEVI